MRPSFECEELRRVYEDVIGTFGQVSYHDLGPSDELTRAAASGVVIMQFKEGTFRDASGATVIQSRLGPAVPRQGFEKLMFPGIEVGLPGWQRAHSQGGGTGFESRAGILYAPEEVNQQYQRLGIERYLRDLLSRKPADTDLWLTTVTTAHMRTLRLKEVEYRVDAVKGLRSRRLFEASIEVADQKLNPRITTKASPALIDYL